MRELIAEKSGFYSLILSTLAKLGAKIYDAKDMDTKINGQKYPKKNY